MWRLGGSPEPARCGWTRSSPSGPVSWGRSPGPVAPSGPAPGTGVHMTDGVPEFWKARLTGLQRHWPRSGKGQVWTGPRLPEGFACKPLPRRRGGPGPRLVLGTWARPPTAGYGRQVGASVLTWVTHAALQTLTQAIEVGGVGPRVTGNTQRAGHLPAGLLYPETCTQSPVSLWPGRALRGHTRPDTWKPPAGATSPQEAQGT